MNVTVIPRLTVISIRPICLFVGWAWLLTVSGLPQTARDVRAQEVNGFTSPYRTVSVATAETGIVSEILVREGDLVEQGQAIAKLDDEVHASLLAIAEQNMRSEGRMAANLAQVKLREDRLQKLEELLSRGNATQEEVERARAELAMAQGQLLSLREDLLVKKLEYERVQLQLERRTVRAPMRGVVTQLLKEEGEFIGPNDPQLMTVVQLDPLLATFSVSSGVAGQTRVGERVKVSLPGEDPPLEGTVEFVAPVVDGKSGTVRVKVRLDNQNGRRRSGEPCLLVDDRRSGAVTQVEEEASTAPEFPKLEVRGLQ